MKLVALEGVPEAGSQAPPAVEAPKP
jgi:hypothetical protein